MKLGMGMLHFVEIDDKKSLLVKAATRGIGECDIDLPDWEIAGKLLVSRLTRD